MPRVGEVDLMAMAQQLSAGGKLQADDVRQLIDAAMQDGSLSESERTDLQGILVDLGDRIDSPEVRARLQAFARMSSAGVLNLAHTLERDGSIDLADARKIIEHTRANWVVSRAEKSTVNEVLSGMSVNAAARAELQALVEGRPTGDIDLHLPEVAGRTYVLSRQGHLSTGSGAEVTYDANGALTVYRAAEALTRAEGVPLASVPAETKAAMLEHLERCFEAGKEDGPLPQIPRQRMRAGAAATLLALIEGCGPADGELLARALDLYFVNAMAEPLAGQRASMYFNLERLESMLRSPDKARLEELRAAVVPERPPYDEWFADGRREINVRHYAHEQCWLNARDPVSSYREQGYKIAEDHSDETPQRWILKKANAAAPGGAVSMRIELVQSHDGIFQGMGDEGTDVVMYTGHSNLGGNVSEELRLGAEERGSKLVLLALCRGKQNMFEVANKYPHTHFITTEHASEFYSMMPVALGVTDSLLAMRDYDQMRVSTRRIQDQGGIDNYFYPHEPRRYAHYDLDRDGVIDGRKSSVDRLYDVGVQLPAGTRVDCVPRANEYLPEDLEGTKVQHAVQFLNTVMTYHVDHGHNTSGFTTKHMDAFHADGWFDGPLDELVRLERTTIDGREVIRVQVNKALADQSGFALGALVQFEVVRQLLTKSRGGRTSREDLARAALFAGEYLCYMYCSLEEARGAIHGVARNSGLEGLSFERLYGAIKSDRSGYVTDGQVNELLKTLGTP